MSPGMTQTHLFQFPPLWCEIMNLGNVERQKMHFLVGESLTLALPCFECKVKGSVLHSNTLRVVLNRCNEWPRGPDSNLSSLVATRKDLMHWKTDLATSGGTDRPSCNPEGNGEWREKGKEPVEPLEHLVTDMVLNMVLFLNWFSGKTCNSRKNEGYFSLTPSVVINMLAKAIFSLQAKMSHMCILVIPLHNLT